MKKLSEKETKERLDFLNGLLKTSQKGEHMKLEYICSFDEANVVLVMYRAMEKILRGLKKMTKSMFKAYLRTVESGTNKLENLIGYKEVCKCLKFYEEEKRLLYDMLEEYYHYVFSGHILDTFLLKPRKEEDLYDHRYKKPENEEKQ